MEVSAKMKKWAIRWKTTIKKMRCPPKKSSLNSIKWRVQRLGLSFLCVSILNTWKKKKYESLLIKSQSETNKTIQKGVLREFLDAYSCPVPVVKHPVFQAAKQPITGGIVRGASFWGHGALQPGFLHTADPARPAVMASPVRMDYGMLPWWMTCWMAQSHSWGRRSIP